MQQAKIYLVGAAGLAVVVLVSLVMLLASTGSAAAAAPVQRTAITWPSFLADGVAPAIQVRRAISIPFGVTPPVSLKEAGHAAAIAGHAECPEGTTSFKVRTTLTQDATGARAKSQFVPFDCAGSGESPWSTVASTQGPTPVAPGTADVCVMALFAGPKEGTIVFRWCYQDVAVVGS